VRIWASSDFNNVWVSPEGHVMHVDTTHDVITVLDESGMGVPLTVNANTQFFSPTSKPGGGLQADCNGHGVPVERKPGARVQDSRERGRSVATPLVAQSIDIETAQYSGAISAPSSAGFTYTRDFRTAGDDYVYKVAYISGNTANGSDAGGNPIEGTSGGTSPIPRCSPADRMRWPISSPPLTPA